MKHWSRKYLLIPFTPFGCAEFVEEVLKKEFNLIYSFPKSVHSLKRDRKILRSYLETKLIETSTPKDGDIVLMGGAREGCHIGIFFKDNNVNYVLHSDRKMRSSSVTRINQLPKIGYYFEGFYTWIK